jgi:hypothetical protein
MQKLWQFVQDIDKKNQSTTPQKAYFVSGTVSTELVFNSSEESGFFPSS